MVRLTAVATVVAACAGPAALESNAGHPNAGATVERGAIDAGSGDVAVSGLESPVPLSGKLEMTVASSVECMYPEAQLHEPAHCRVTLPIVIHNGLATMLSLHQIQATRSRLRPPNGLMKWDFGDTVVIPAGGSYTFEAKQLNDDTYQFTAALTDAQGIGHSAEGQTVVRDPRRDAAQIACKACDGTWGPMGLGGHIACDCKTKDAGKVCHAPSECEGQCIDARPEWTDKTHYREVGTCSPRTSPFGCQSRVEPGVHSGPFHRSTMCVD